MIARLWRRILGTGDVESVALVRIATGLSILACMGAAFAFLREMVVASRFGAGAVVDAYLVAIAVPTLIGTTATSTIEAAFLPRYVACRSTGSADRATALAEAAHFRALLAGAGLTLALWFLYPRLLRFQAPGFPDETLALSAHLLAFAAPSALFVCLYAQGRSVLNAEGRFFFPALAPGVNACVMVAVILIGSRAMGIAAAAAGYAAGTAAMWLTVYLPQTAWGLPGRGLAIGAGNPDLARFFAAVKALLVGVAAMSAIPVIDRFMASRFPAGTISALAYADRLTQIPNMLIATAVTTALFPTLARDAAAGDLSEVRRTLRSGIGLIATALVPIAVLSILYSHDIVMVVFGRGAFTASSVEMTAAALEGFAIGMVFLGTLQVVPRVFNALHLAGFVAFSGILNLGFKVLFNLLLVPRWGYVGFAFSTSLMSLSTGCVMLYLLRRRLHGLDARALAPKAIAIGTAAAGMIATAVIGKLVLGTLAPFPRLLIGGVGSGAAYAIVLLLMNSRESAGFVAPPGHDARARVHELV